MAALLAPYLLLVLARSSVTKADYVQDPRAFNERLTGWHRRAHLAQLNAFENFPGFAAAVLVAQFTQVPQIQIDTVALAFMLFRILHASFYIADKPNLRSLSWALHRQPICPSSDSPLNLILRKTNSAIPQPQVG